MKFTIENLLQEALTKLLANQNLVDSDFSKEIQVERARDPEHGDFSSNVALQLAKTFKCAPKILAERIVAEIPGHIDIESITIADPGFINFYLKTASKENIIHEILEQGAKFGHCKLGAGKKILIEFVSANPTGPLHVGHGRGAAFGATVVNLLNAIGYKVASEYYVNDAGRQMDILAVSVWIRYLIANQIEVAFPCNGYQGAYVDTMAKELAQRCGRDYVHTPEAILTNLPNDSDCGGDKEIYIDALIERARSLLGDSGFAIFHQHALESVLEDIKNDLAAFGVKFDNWFSEQSLVYNGDIKSGIEALKAANLTYEKDGALWFLASKLGDEKDRVLIRGNGQTTYFASDVAYHWNKYARGFDKVVDIFGADHHGYVPRVRAAVQALGHDDTQLSVLLVQFAILYRGKERVQMSTRSGSFVTLRELRDEVGNDAARFFYISRKSDQHMDFDLELAKSNSNDNPVYYIQYAHARICSVFRQLKERNLEWDEDFGLLHLEQLSTPHEQELITFLAKFPEIVIQAAQNYEPHRLTFYLRELAHKLHSYYNSVVLLCESKKERTARLCLLKSVSYVLKNGLELIGVTALERM